MKKIVSEMFHLLTQEILLVFQRRELRKQLQHISPVLSLDTPGNDVEIMSIVSHYDLPLYLTAIKTLVYYSKKNVLITVLDDGTFTEADKSILFSFIQNVRYIPREEAEKKLQKILNGKKFCQKFRKEAQMARKLIDIVYLSTKKRIIMMDSDVIFFKCPAEIINWIDTSNDKPFFMNDGKSVYLISDIEAAHCFGLHLVPKVNTGLTGFNKDLVEIDFVEKFLEIFNSIDESGYRLWKLPPTIEQTFLSLIFSKKKKQEIIRLPDTYNISADAETAENKICRHYVTPVRKLFYPKAIQTLKRIILEEKIDKST